MERLNTSDTRSFQSYSPTTSYSSPSGSTYSFSSSSPNTYGSNNVIEANESESIMQSNQNNHRRASESVIQYHNHNHNYGYLDSSINDEINNSGVCDRSFQGYSRPVNRFFPDGVVDILNKWFYENQTYPYPDENMTNFLAKEANISPKQVRKWFANKRVRSNKCYKQTFRIRRVDSTLLDQSNRIPNRRQTKSVSDSTESLPMQQQCYTYSNVLYDDHNRSPESTERNSYKWPTKDQHLSSPESSSPASSSPSNSFASSSPINSHISIFEQAQNAQQLSVASAANAFNNSLYNPYFLMNFLQNPSMALQAVLANSFLTQNNNNVQESKIANSPIDQASAKLHKRKPSLQQNRCLNESFKANNLNLIEEVVSSVVETKSCLRDLLTKPKRVGDDSTCSNNKSMRSTFSLDELSTSLNSASMQNAYYGNIHSHDSKPVSYKSPKKINFGDISSLI